MAVSENVACSCWGYNVFAVRGTLFFLFPMDFPIFEGFLVLRKILWNEPRRFFAESVGEREMV
jgi:hypothetical protein